MLLAAIALIGAASPPLTVIDVLAKSEALQKKGMLAMFSSDLGLIKAEADRDMNVFSAEMLSAWKAHRSLPACPPVVSNGWKISYTTDEVLKFYRSIPPEQRRMSSAQAFGLFMRAKYPCR